MLDNLFLICYTSQAVKNTARINARVAELADALDSGSSERLAHGGSSPPPRTTKRSECNKHLDLFLL